MVTNIISYIMSSEPRIKIVKTLLEYDTRIWSCYWVEDTTKLPHATVYRVIEKLVEFGLLRTERINKRDIIYRLVIDSPYVKELKRILDIDRIIAKEIAETVVKQIKKAKINDIKCIMLYGSSVKGNMKPNSDIDILIFLKKLKKKIEKEIQDIAAEYSYITNKAISVMTMDLKEIEKEKDQQFLKSVKEDIVVLYGKAPF